MNNTEIEKKFLIKKLPENLESYKYHIIEQGYLSTEPVIRVRRSDDEYYMTYKGKGLEVREEYNLPLNEESYENLSPKCIGHVIKKDRYIIPIENDLKIELDVFEYPEGLVMAEVEFPSVEMANAFIAPEWFAEEVTNDPKYHNVNMI